MTNVVPFRHARPDEAVARLPATLADAEELDIRLWELVMSGQRGSEEFRRIQTVRHSTGLSRG